MLDIFLYYSSFCCSHSCVRTVIKQLFKMFLKYMNFFMVLRLVCFYVHSSKAILAASAVSNSINYSCEGLDDISCPDGFKCDFEVNKCVPYCSIECGLGRCIGAEKCKCDLGYYSEALMEDSEPPRCKPICEFCEGTCIRPYTCVCKPEFEAVNVSVDGGDCDCFGNCTGRICESTKCILKSSIETITEKWSSTRRILTSTGSYVDASESESNKVVSFRQTTAEKDYSYELFSTEADLNEYYLETFHVPESKDTKIQASYTWLYFAAGLVTFLIAVTVLITKRHAVFHCFRRNNYYIVEEKQEGTSQSHSMDMDFLTVE